MSKIPRSFATPIPVSKLPTLGQPSLSMLEVPKFVCPSSKMTPPDSVKKLPLHEINKEIKTPATIGKPDIVKMTPKLMLNTNNKRVAPSEIVNPPKKQFKPAPKAHSANPPAKIAPYDFKAKYNDLLEKHKVVKSENSEVKEQFDMCLDELETLKSSLDSVSSKSSEATIRLENLTLSHDNLKTQFEDLSNMYASEKTTSAELSGKVQDLTNQACKLNTDLANITTELGEANSSLASKVTEYDLLKKSFENEVLKCSQLSAACEENQIKILSFTSELTFLNTRQKIIDQKNEDNTKTIVHLTELNLELNKNLNTLTDDFLSVQKELDEKSAECTKFTEAYNLEARKGKEKDEVIREKSEKILNYSSDLSATNKCKELLELKNMQNAKQIDELTQHNIELQKTIESMHENQKKLRNEIQDLKGHIRVFCRIRPPLSGESFKQLLSVDVLDSCTMEIDKALVNSISGGLKKQKHNFTFDGIFPPNCPQSDVFSEVSGLIQSALDGYNVCIFAYGQTGSGKTYTMEGLSGPDGVGIIPRAIEMIFTSLPNLKKVGWEFTLHASFLEIYNENIYDLLNPNKEQEEHCIKMADSKGLDVYVTNLKEESVTTYAELMKLLTTSQRNRQTAATTCNERSSRSHSVSKIKISAYHEQRKERYVSNLNLVDLAGSESGKTTQRMDETKSINKSLSELSKVILALQSKQSHIPYRNSKLTYLLMPSLGGNSKTLMLVNIAQLDECYQETVNSLRFAAKVNSCRTGVSKKNITTA